VAGLQIERSIISNGVSRGEFSLLFGLLKILELKACPIHHPFNLFIPGVKGEDTLPYRDGLVQVAGSILFEAAFEQVFYTGPNLCSQTLFIKRRGAISG